jgi:hypothetical protein
MYMKVECVAQPSNLTFHLSPTSTCGVVSLWVHGRSDLIVTVEVLGFRAGAVVCSDCKGSDSDYTWAVSEVLNRVILLMLVKILGAFPVMFCFNNSLDAI